MKFLICLSLVIPSAALVASSGFGDQLFNPKASHDANAVFQQLSGMVASAQQKLGAAERHHKKVVKRIRKESADMLIEEAKIYGDGIYDYSAELLHSVDELQKVVDVAKAGLAQSEATPAKPNDWRDPEVAERAKLGAQLASADRTIKKAERRRARAVREGEETGEETLEDEAQKLGMKLGDMTPLVDKAKQALEAAAERKPSTTNLTASNASNSKKVDLKSLQDELAKATAKNAAATKDANQKLQGFLAKTGKDVTAKAAKIKEDLQVAQQQEIEKVTGKKTVEKPASVAKKISKTVSAKKTVEKVASVAKTSASVAKTAEKKVTPVATKETSAKVATPIAKKESAVKTSK